LLILNRERYFIYDFDDIINNVKQVLYQNFLQLFIKNTMGSAKFDVTLLHHNLLLKIIDEQEGNFSVNSIFTYK